MADECNCGDKSGTFGKCDPCPDKIKPETEGWISCAELPLPPEFTMVNGLWSKSGHGLSDFVDTSAFPPKINEGLYLQVVALFGPEGVLFGDGSTPAAKGISRAAWKKRSLEESGVELDPLAMLAWQRRDTGLKAAGKKIVNKFRPRL